MPGRPRSISEMLRRTRLVGLYLVLVVTLAGPAGAQERSAALEAALKAESRRVELIARLRETVVAIFPAVSEGDAEPPRNQGGGSGVIIDADGHALTNYHVVREAKKVSVGLSDGRVCSAVVKGRDPTGDIAVIRIEGESFPFAELGDSDRLEIGGWVLAMGNPFGYATDFKPTVTQGVVSGLHRYLPGTLGGDLIYTDCIQVDAPINPGNSGGPLFSGDGKLVGINGRVSARPSRGSVNTGVGFAIPINQIREFLPDLIAGKRVHHAVLGVELSEGLADVTIKRVLPDSAADKAGLEPGDVVRSFRDREIRSEMELINRIGILPAGKRARVVVERRGRQYDIEVALGQRPTAAETASVTPKPPVTPPREEPPAPPEVPADLTPDDVARRMARAMGGYEALAGIKDTISTGRVRRLMLRRVWVGGRIVQYDLGPFRVRHETTYRYRGSELNHVTVLDGDAGWVYTDAKLRDMTETEVAAARTELEAYELLSTPDGWKNADAKLAGTEVLDRRTLVVVVTKDTDGGTRRWSFDPESWHLVRCVSTSAVTRDRIDSRLSDYRAVGRVVQPFRLSRYVNGILTQVIELESVEFNRGISEEVLKRKPPVQMGPKVY